MNTVLVGGGTGFIGTHLCNLLRSNNYQVKIISRMPGPQRLTWHDIQNLGIPENTNIVVNLAGQNVLDPTKRWTPGFKQNVWNSRVKTTQSLSKAISEAKETPVVFITISGVGIYKPSESEVYTETSEVYNSDFLSKLCTEWERAAQLPSETNCRQVTIRSGVVLGRDGGMIQQLYLPYFFGLGGPIGNGKQFLPWIHIKDLSRLILFAIEKERAKGVINGVAPQTITNKQFSDTFAKALSRPAVIPLPKPIVNLIFNEERAKMITEGQRVLPRRAQEMGFKFHYPDIISACDELVNAKKSNSHS